MLIINADDLGASEETNDVIFDLIASKLISSSTIIANSPTVEEVAKKAKNFTECSFGIHLNITEFYPLSSTNALKTILDEQGGFVGSHKLRKIPIITPSLSDAIFTELCAQVDKLSSLGIKISHIDSHEHIHNMPQIFPILKCLQKKYGICKVRISRNIYLPNYSVPKTLLFKKKIYNFILRNYYPTKTTSGFCNFSEFYENVKINNLKHNSIEIMLHPGHEKYRNEANLLNHFLHEKLAINFKIINYNDL